MYSLVPRSQLFIQPVTSILTTLETTILRIKCTSSFVVFLNPVEKIAVCSTTNLSTKFSPTIAIMTKICSAWTSHAKNFNLRTPNVRYLPSAWSFAKAFQTFYWYKQKLSKDAIHYIHEYKLYFGYFFRYAFLATLRLNQHICLAADHFSAVSFYAQHTVHSFISIYSSFITVVLNYCYESHMQLPSTLCADLSSCSIKPITFCVTDFVLLWSKMCQLTCVKISLVQLSNKVIKSGFGSLQQKGWELLICNICRNKKANHSNLKVNSK